MSGWHPIDSPEPAPLLLTPELAAEWFSEYGPSGRANKALSDVIDGRTACVRVMSEDECRAEFEAWYFLHAWKLPTPAEIWLACARAMGAVR